MKSPKETPVSEIFRFEALGFRDLEFDALRLAGSLAIGRASVSADKQTSSLNSGMQSGSDVKTVEGAARCEIDVTRGLVVSIEPGGGASPELTMERGGAIWMPPGAEASTLGCRLGPAGDGEIAAA